MHIRRSATDDGERDESTADSNKDANLIAAGRMHDLQGDIFTLTDVIDLHGNQISSTDSDTKTNVEYGYIQLSPTLIYSLSDLSVRRYSRKTAS